MKKFGFTLALICTQLIGFSQATNVSPYSRYAIGDINPVWFGQNTAMGGATVALVDSFQVNVLNPASYSFTAFQSPTFDVGMRGRMLNISTNASSTTANQISLNNITLVMPFSRRWGTAFGILPYSTSGYNIKFSEENTTLGGTVSTFYRGRGGINRVFVGTAYTLLKNKQNIFSVGGNISYLFGDLEKTRKLVLPSQTGLFNSQIVSSVFAHDIMFDAGLVYRNMLDNTGRKQITFGASTTFGTELGVSRSILAHTVDAYGSFVDTVNYVEDERGTLYIPQRFSFGLTYDLKGNGTSKLNNYKLTFSVQYNTQDWSKYKENFSSYTYSDTLRKTSGINFGVQYIPHVLIQGNGKISPFRLINYRVGFYTNKNYLNIGSTAINNWGVTAGFGIPLINSVSYSMLNIGFEYGSRGTTTNNLLLENYYGFHLGVAFSPSRVIDRWFVKRKYD